MRLRHRNSARSSGSPSRPGGGESMICSISGRVALAFSPITEVSTGTWRQP
jgi:DNA-binding IclR family transcriptional regulator